MELQQPTSTAKYDKTARDLPKLSVHDNVRFNEKNSCSRKGTVIEIADTPRSYHVKTDRNTIIRRNRRHLIPTSETVEIEEDDNHLESTDPLVDNESTDIHLELTDPQIDNQSTSLPEPTNKAPMNTTRSGRVVKKPLRYQ
jgi:hypothetical protein